MSNGLLKKIPGAGACLSALALYAFLRGMLLAMAVVLPPLFERLRGYPRAEALATLGVWLSPILFIGIAHAAMTSVLDRLDTQGASRGRTSAWAGLYSWLVALFATATTIFVVMILEPPRRPPPPDSDALATVLSAVSPLGGSSMMIYSAVWIVIAAILFKVEQLAHRNRRHEA